MTPELLPTSNSIAINAENAQHVLIERSAQQLVIAYFWADQHKGSLALLPIMTSIAAESSDFCTLATIDIARNAMIARQLEIQQLPTIMLFQNGRPVDGITGDANEAQIRELLGRYLPKSWDLQLNTAQQLLAQQQFSEALPLLRSAYNDSQERADIGLHLAQAFLGLNRIDEADSLLQKTRLADQDWLYQQLHSQIQLKRTAAKTPELETLEQALAHNPDDLGIQMQLAIQYQQESMHRQALELLLSILKKDKQFNNGQAKSIMLDMFKSLGTQDPLVIEFQRQLFAILY